MWKHRNTSLNLDPAATFEFMFCFRMGGTENVNFKSHGGVHIYSLVKLHEDYCMYTAR